MIVNETSLPHVVEILCEQDKIALDTETTGLYPFHGDRLFSIIIATSEEEYYFDFNIGGLHKDNLKYIQEILDKVKYVYMCNAKYDLSMLHVDGINCDKPYVLDLPAMAKIHYSKHRKGFLSLDYLAKFYLKKESKDTAVKEYIKKNKALPFHDSSFY